MVALARYQAFALDNAGNVLASPTVEVRDEATASLVALFSDRAGASGIGNPFTGGSDGLIAFHVAGGAYKITVTLGGTVRTFRYVAVGTTAETDITGIVASLGAATGAIGLGTGLSIGGGNLLYTPPNAIGFYAHKDSVDQTGLLTGAYTNITFPAEMDDAGGYYDPSNNWWTPPAGRVAMSSQVYQTQHAVTTALVIVKIRRLHVGVTVTIASPGVVGWPVHNLKAKQPIQFTNSGGALPTGIVANTVYYVSTAGLQADSFQFSSSVANAAAGTSINTSGSQSGTHTGYCDVEAGMGISVGATGFAFAHVAIEDAISNGTDHFQVIYFYTADNSPTNSGVADGNPAHTYFTGHWIGP